MDVKLAIKKTNAAKLLQGSNFQNDYEKLTQSQWGNGSAENSDQRLKLCVNCVCLNSFIAFVHV